MIWKWNWYLQTIQQGLQSNPYTEEHLSAKTSDSHKNHQLQIHPTGCPTAPIVMQKRDLPIVLQIDTVIENLYSAPDVVFAQQMKDS